MFNRFLTLLSLTAAVVVFGATNAFAFVEFSPSVHKMLVFMHVFGAVIFLGNIIVSAMWMANAKKTGDTIVLHFAVRMVHRADRIFTMPGVVLILIPGILALGPWGGFGKASWAELALALFIVTGVIWSAVLVPLQRRMIQATGEAVDLKIALADHFYTTFGWWAMWGGIATLLPLFALYLMVFKPHLWG